LVLKLANLIVIEANWFACVWGLANGYSWLGCLTVAISVALQIAPQEHRLRQLAFVGGMMVFGFAFDSLLVLTGQIELVQDARWPPPAMVALWANLSTAYPLSLSWLRRHLWFGAGLGVLGGAAAYAGGAELQAIHIPEPAGWHLVVIGLLWGGALPLSLWIHRRLFPVDPILHSLSAEDS
jgi:hypothetical protein